MIEIERHIEILLLHNDCVIVPGLGGFMAHHTEAHYDESEQMFLPPQRSLGFNPQLKLNDSLLAQSYVEAYDISYPEAIRRIESEVNEIKQHLSNEGTYELNAIGTLSINDDGNYVFEPNEAGIQTPELYGLYSFEMKTLESRKNAIIEASLQNAQAADDNSEADNSTIRIKVAWIRNAVATAAAILIFFLFTTPVSNSVSQHVNMSALHNNVITKLIPQDINKDEVAVSSKLIKESIAKTDSSILFKPEASQQPAEMAKETEGEVVKSNGTDNFCIVMASHIPLKNAEELVGKLHEQGYEQAYTYRHNKITRVVYGHYKSEAEAYNELRNIRGNEHFEQSWVLKKR